MRGSGVGLLVLSGAGGDQPSTIIAQARLRSGARTRAPSTSVDFEDLAGPTRTGCERDVTQSPDLFVDPDRNGKANAPSRAILRTPHALLRTPHAILRTLPPAFTRVFVTKVRCP